MFFNNYLRPGRGVNKRNPKEPEITTFLDILPDKMWNLCKLNMLYMLSILPFFFVSIIITGLVSSPLTNSIVSTIDIPDPQSTLAVFDLLMRVVLSLMLTVLWGQGPFTAGMTYIVRNYSREEHCWLFSDYLGKTKENFWQSLAMWLIDLAVFCLFAIAATFYISQSMYLPAFLLAFMFITYTMMHLYIYQQIITFRLPILTILKNSFLFAFGKAPRNLVLLFIQLLVHVIIPFVIIVYFYHPLALFIMILAELIILPVLTSFITNFFVYSVIKEYIPDQNDDNRLDY